MVSISGRTLLKCSARVEGNFWDRESIQLCEKDSWGLIQDHFIELPQLFFDMHSLEELVTLFESWSNINDTVNLQLSGCEDQNIRLVIGRRDDLITGEHKPAFTFICEMSRINVEIYYVIDSSCISLAREQLIYCLNCKPPFFSATLN